MAYANKMTRLLQKIERQLGTTILNLPKGLQKDDWAVIIEEDVLDVYSRFYPHRLLYELRETDMDKDGYFYIDENIIPGDVEIIGVKDIAFDKINEGFLGSNSMSGIYDTVNPSFGIDDFINTKMRADMRSLYNLSIFVDIELPNKISLKNSTGYNIKNNIGNYPIYIFTKHAKSLMTIEPTKMNVFEELSLGFVAEFLYNNLKYFDNLDTVFAGNIDLKLDELKEKADRKNETINKLEEKFVSVDNKNQPAMYCV